MEVDSCSNPSQLLGTVARSELNLSETDRLTPTSDVFFFESLGPIPPICRHPFALAHVSTGPKIKENCLARVLRNDLVRV